MNNDIRQEHIETLTEIFKEHMENMDFKGMRLTIASAEVKGFPELAAKFQNDMDALANEDV